MTWDLPQRLDFTTRERNDPPTSSMPAFPGERKRKTLTVTHTCQRCGHPVLSSFGGTWTHKARVVDSPREYRHRIVAVPITE